MFKLNVKLLLKNRTLWAWPIIAMLLAVFIGIYGDIQPAGNSYSFMLGAGGNTLPSAFFINSVLGFFILIAVIGVPFHLSKNIDSERASLILSKPISRTDFFFAEFAAVMTVVTLYTLVSIIALAVLLLVEASIFPYQLYLAMLLYIPLSFFVIYDSIVLLLVLTESYLASVLISYLLITPLSGFLFNAESFLRLFGWNSESMIRLTHGLSYLIPSAGGLEKLFFSMNHGGAPTGNMSLSQIATGVLHNGFAVFDWQIFGFVLISCVPFFLLSFYLMRRKEF